MRYLPINRPCPTRHNHDENNTNYEKRVIFLLTAHARRAQPPTKITQTINGVIFLLCYFLKGINKKGINTETMSGNSLIIRGARQHNLANIDLTLPRDKLIVITGISGSGKSSLAFDTIYAEGQRRYVESLSAYARQFLGQMDKPDVDSIEGLSPAISIDQKTTSRNPRSTVGTVTEIYDYLRLLYARIGRPHCPKCGQPISQQTVDQMVDQLLGYPERTRLQILAPLVRGRKGEHLKVLEDVRKAGFVRVRVNGQVREVTEEIKLEKNKKHTIEVVVDRIVLRPDQRQRLADSLETALKLADGLVIAEILGEKDKSELLVFSQNFACPDCGISLEEITPRMFSFNTPYGACPDCGGLGMKMEVDPALVVPDHEKSIAGGGIAPLANYNGIYLYQFLESLAAHYGFSTQVPLKELDPEHLKLVLYGAGKEKIRFQYRNSAGEVSTYAGYWEGVINTLARRHRETQSEWSRQEIERYMSTRCCPECRGARLRPESLAVRVGSLNIYELTRLSVIEVQNYLAGLALTEREQTIGYQVLKEIRERLGFMMNVGLDYLTLDRAAGTLSGGEAQRIRLATQIGSSLMGVLYILDEPSIGLHQRDNDRLIATLKRLRDLGIEGQNPTAYYFNYRRLVNGIPYPGNGISVSVDAINQRITQFDVNWQNLNFPSPAGCLGTEQANAAYLKNQPLTLAYTQVYGSTGPGEVKLVYLPVTTPNQLVSNLIDARTGEYLDWQGKPLSEQPRASHFTDIAGHFGEEEISLLGQAGIFGEYGDTFRPEESVTAVSLLRAMLQATQGSWATADLTDQEIIKRAQEIKWVEEGELTPAGAVTRENLAKLMIRLLGMDRAARIEGIYKVPYKDADALSPGSLGYASLTWGLEIIRGTGDTFNPNQVTTRAEAAVVLVRTLRVKA